MFLYIAIIGMLTYLGSFGGGLNVISFGWDFAVLAVASWIIFEIAKHIILGSS